jgi:segregation and condensation protein A
LAILVRVPQNLKQNEIQAELDLTQASELESGSKDSENNPKPSLETKVQVEQGVFNLSIDEFDGPIDLLLHIVKRNELPIEKLSLAKVADQFLNCVKQAEFYDLEIAGEYLVIAANLLSIKAALLVDPRSEIQLDSDEGPDPHDELLNRLRAAAIYQEAARNIGNRDLLGINVFAPIAPSAASSLSRAEQPLAKHDSTLLMQAWKRVLAKIPVAPKQLVMSWTKVSVTDKMKNFVERLKAHAGEKMSFEDLMATESDLPNLVASFVAILEMCKRQIAQVMQEGLDQQIFIALRSEDLELPAETMAESEFDQVTQVVENF